MMQTSTIFARRSGSAWATSTRCTILNAAALTADAIVSGNAGFEESTRTVFMITSQAGTSGCRNREANGHRCFEEQILEGRALDNATRTAFAAMRPPY